MLPSSFTVLLRKERENGLSYVLALTILANKSEVPHSQRHPCAPCILCSLDSEQGSGSQLPANNLLERTVNLPTFKKSFHQQRFLVINPLYNSQYGTGWNIQLRFTAVMVF